jgi:drug/metabolite transporter (DMT)-like permease
MMWGLTRVSALASALLLNLEAPFTLLLALTLFREHLGLRSLGAAAAIVLGGALLGVRPGELHADPLGIAALAGACACWGLDNNLTQRLSVRDPLAVVRVKALAAGACNLALGWALGQRLPVGGALGGALALGAVSYGASIVLDLLALRHLGAAREAAFFATAPFAGALLAIPLVGEHPTAVDLSAMALMAVGAFALARERHSHRHTHEPLEHEHLHVHDAHHQHAHDAPFTEPHSHPHSHGALTHEHAHASDVHHRHSH